ncbi:MAG: stage II sporulation protein M [Dethiobacteria bacterium]|jgi:stage II sporulation protein M
MFINHRVKRILYENLNWIVLSLLFFILGIVASLLTFSGGNNFILELTETQQALLEEMARIIFSGSPVTGILILFLNNFFASLQMIIFGIILGIPTLLSLFANGAMLGGVAANLGEGGASGLAFLAIGILPHGIFELPAFFTSAAFGLKIGFHLVFPLPQKKRWESLGIIWKEFFAVFPLILLMLITAAIVEVLVTPRLIQLVFNNMPNMQIF